MQKYHECICILSKKQLQTQWIFTFWATKKIPWCYNLRKIFVVYDANVFKRRTQFFITPIVTKFKWNTRCIIVAHFFAFFDCSIKTLEFACRLIYMSIDMCVAYWTRTYFRVLFSAGMKRKWRELHAASICILIKRYKTNEIQFDQNILLF